VNNPVALGPVPGSGKRHVADAHFRRHLLNIIEAHRTGKGNGMLMVRASDMLKLWDELIELRARIPREEAPSSPIPVSDAEPAVQ
jgi:hypothetical protein